MIFLLSLMALLQFSADSTYQLLGTWLNHDPSTMGITQVVITTESGALRAQAWGACDPVDCDFGVADLASKDGTLTAVFDQGLIATTMYFVRLPNDELLVVSKSQFRNTPDHKERELTELFERQELNANDESARKLLKKASETYGNLAAAEFQFEVASLYTDQATATRSQSISHIWLSPSGKWRTETSGSRERQIQVSDGKTLWTFFPESNEYNAYPVGSMHSGLVEHYRSLNRVRGSATIAGSERFGDFDCTVVKIERPDSVRLLWIDPKTDFVLKDESTLTESTPPNSSTLNSTTTFSVARVSPDMDDQLFSFDPLKFQAKQRDELRKKAQSASVGTPAPDFALSDLQNQSIRLSELRGKVVLIDFWATWCVPCRAELPTVELLHRDFEDKGLIVLGVDDEEPNDQAAFLTRFGYTFRSLVDPAERVRNLYKVGGIPTTVLIDREGTIRVFELGSSYDSLSDAVRKAGII